MPAYDYQCDNKKCKHETELHHPMSEVSDDPRACPKCGKPTLKRAFKTAPKVHLYFSPMHPRVNRGRGH